MHLFTRRKIVIEKNIGETPLQALGRFVSEHPRYRGLPATYAGRLDPMASGKLILLFGVECKNKEKYLGLDKEYVVEILIGVGSDTGDVLGVVSSTQASIDRNALKEVLQKEVGSFERAYPAYSSKAVNGKPLFMHALEGTLGSIQIPTHIETIYKINLTRLQTLSHIEVRERVTSLLACAPKGDEESKKLGADFRIAEVKKSWQDVFEKERDYVVATIRVRCATGTYMRSLASRVGEALGTSALALSIHRTKVG